MGPGPYAVSDWKKRKKHKGTNIFSLATLHLFDLVLAYKSEFLVMSLYKGEDRQEKWKWVTGKCGRKIKKVLSTLENFQRAHPVYYHHHRKILDVGYWVLYAQILMIRVGALLCSRNEQADLTTLCPIWIQTSQYYWMTQQIQVTNSTVWPLWLKNNFFLIPSWNVV